GVMFTKYTTDGSGPALNPPAGLFYSGSFTLTTTATVKFRSIDTAGNQEACCGTTTKTITVTADTTPPTSSISCNGGSCGGSFARGVSVTFAATDDGGGSGLAAIYYTTDGSDPTTGSPTYSAPITLNATATVKYRAQDAAGNLEATNSQQVEVVVPDTTP